MTGKFDPDRGADGFYRLRLLACNGLVLLAGRAYRDRAGFLRGVAAVQRSCADGTRFEQRPVPKGGFCFVLKAPDGAVLGTSRHYDNQAACRRGMASVQRHAAEAKIAAEPARPAGMKRPRPPRRKNRG